MDISFYETEPNRTDYKNAQNRTEPNRTEPNRTEPLIQPRKLL